MQIHFYSKIINTNSLVEALNELDLSDEQRSHLLGVAQSTIHHAILDAILAELSEADREIFLEHVTEDNHDKIWKFLHEKVDKIEEKIVSTADALKKELHQDIQETKGN